MTRMHREHSFDANQMVGSDMSADLLYSRISLFIADSNDERGNTHAPQFLRNSLDETSNSINVGTASPVSAFLCNPYHLTERRAWALWRSRAYIRRR